MKEGERGWEMKRKLAAPFFCVELRPPELQGPKQNESFPLFCSSRPQPPLPFSFSVTQDGLQHNSTLNHPAPACQGLQSIRLALSLVLLPGAAQGPLQRWITLPSPGRNRRRSLWSRVRPLFLSLPFCAGVDFDDTGWLGWLGEMKRERDSQELRRQSGHKEDRTL